jgi:uncharacterized protein YjiS (DUF1127 family)
VTCHSLKTQGPAFFETERSSEDGLGFLMLIRSIVTLPRRWNTRVQERRYLYDLSDRLLADIGLTRADVHREAAKPFWQPLDPATSDPRSSRDRHHQAYPAGG